MGRVAKVVVDQTPELSDLLFGTNYDGELNANYRIASILDLLNKNNGIQYEFSDGVNTEITYNTVGKFFTDTNSVNPLNFTKLLINKQNLKPLDLTPLFDKLITMQNLYLRLQNEDDFNNFFEFKVNSIQSFTNYFRFNISLWNNYYLGLLINNKKYTIFFDIKESGVGNNTSTNSYFPGGW